MKKSKSQKVKKVCLNLGALVLVAVIAVVGTLAYLSQVSDSKKNTFNGSKGLTTKVEEPEWHPEDGNNYTPGKVITKDPVFTNESETQDVYAALRVSYQIKVKTDGTNTEYREIPYSEFVKIAKTRLCERDNGNIKVTDGIVQLNGTDNFNTTNWEAADANNTIFYYKEILNKKNGTKCTTESLFDAVVITDLYNRETKSEGINTKTKWDGGTLTDEEKKDIENNHNIKFTTTAYNADGTAKASADVTDIVGLPDFRIVVVGAAVSTDISTEKGKATPSYADAKDELKALLTAANVNSDIVTP